MNINTIFKEMSTSQRVLKNTLFLYIRTIVSLLVSVFTTRILLGALGASDFGLYNVVGGAIAMLGFLTSSMSSMTQRFLSYAEGAGEENKVIKYFNNAMIIHYSLAILMIIIFFLAGFIFFNGLLNIPDGKQETAVIIYICMIVSTVFSITVVPYDAEINAHENMLFYSLIGIIDVLLKLVIAVLVLYSSSEKLIFYSVLMAIESFVIRFVSQIYCKRYYEECKHLRLRKYYDITIIKELLTFAGWNLSYITTSMIALYGMNIVINHYFGTKVNAAMGIAIQLSGVMMGLSMNMIKAITPVLVKSEGGNQHQRMLEISYISCKFSYLLFAFACLPVLIFINKILSVWLKEVPDWTESFCIYLIIATLIEQFTVVLYQSIMAGGNIKAYNITASINNVLPLIISIFIFQYFTLPPYWIFIISLIFKSVVGGMVNLYFSDKTLGINILQFFKKVISPTVLSTVLIIFIGFGILTLCHQFRINELFGCISLFVFIIPIYWVIAFDHKERMIFSSFIINFKDKV